ncbi:MAG: xylulose 5-phosphate 3-epimerase, partial [Planctomycetes bacterium]|nr:xylulose 5-phosphate 3-epimerase [Planctomycetota bacterium]
MVDETVRPDEAWAKGYGVIQHTDETRARVAQMAAEHSAAGDGVPLYELLAAADRLTSAAMWLVVHDTYAQQVYLDGRALAKGDMKPRPEGHTGSALNICPAYVGYLAANALTGHTRGWMMEQGHAVSGVDSANLLVGNVVAAHAKRYGVGPKGLTEEGLTRFVRDFYSYRLGADGSQEAPRGSHVNAYTAGGIAEGGYLGFAGLQYVHMPLPGERLVTFLSDGAFEEQRGPDWAPRWWRHADCGLVAPIMIANGRRIDQRTTMSMSGGSSWFRQHLELNGFDPLEFDGRDPAAYVWAIWEMERRQEAAPRKYPIRLPYGISVTVKGYGFPGAGTNPAHNLPLGAALTDEVVALFNEGARKLHVPLEALRAAAAVFNRHKNRPRERDHVFANRDVKLKRAVQPRWLTVGEKASAMDAVDEMFVETCLANPHLRARVGNPDEMRSNRMERTLDTLHHRVTDPEAGVAEALDGKVITALNEEAVASAALANKGGINLVVTYEAFGAKMHGAIRQEIIFSDHCGRHGRPQRWLSIPIVLTSHTYENGKNEQSHQDPSLCEALIGEPAHVSRVVFPADANSASAVLAEVYRTRGQLWTLVVPKRELPVVLDGAAASSLVRDGAVSLRVERNAKLILTAIGAYQLGEVLRASRRLEEKSVPHCVVCLLEPRRFADPRGPEEEAVCVPPAARRRFYPAGAPKRIFVTHTRSGRSLGLLHALDTGADTVALGYRNLGGTLNEAGMLFANHQS